MNQTVLQASALIVPLILAIVFHEVAHGWVARMLGDPTAAERNRLSLNPLRHVDPVGTILVPGFLALIKAPIVGWAKPVPVDFARLRNPRSGMMLVAAAGPMTNLVMAGIGAVLLGLTVRALGPGDHQGTVAEFVTANLVNFLTINVFLAIFNLLPIPPFDGSHIVQGLLPAGVARSYAGLRRYAMTLMLALIVVLPSISPKLDVVRWIVVPPVQWLIGHYAAIAQAIAGR